MKFELLSSKLGKLSEKFYKLKKTSSHKSYDRLYVVSLVVSILFHIFLFLFLPPDFYKLFYSFEDPEISLDPFSPWGVESLHKIEVIPIKVLEPKDIASPTKTEKVPKIKVVEEVAQSVVEEEQTETDSNSDVETNVLSSDDTSNDPGMAAKRSSGSYVQPIPKMLYYPKRPKSAKKSNGGSVHLLVHVTANGKVDDVKIEKGLDNEDMNNAAVEAAYRTVFDPAVREGTRVPTWTRYAVTF